MNVKPKWLKLREQKNAKGKKGKRKQQAHLVGKSTPFDESDTKSDGEIDMKQLVKMEVKKYL